MGAFPGLILVSLFWDSHRMFAFMETWDVFTSFSFAKAGFFTDELILALFPPPPPPPRRPI